MILCLLGVTMECSMTHFIVFPQIIGVIFKENVAEELKDIISELEETRGVIKGSRNLLQDETPKEPKKMLVEDVSADCGSASGGGICLLLDRVPEASTVDVTLYRINFTGNSAGIGGIMYSWKMFFFFLFSKHVT